MVMCLLNRNQYRQPTSGVSAEWMEALNIVSLSLLWQLFRGTEKHVFLSFSIEHPFILSADFFFFLPELGWLNLFFRQAKLMAVQKLIVQACVWLPVGEWMWITVRSRFTMTCFFLGTGNGEKAMGECWTLGCVGVPPRHLNLSLYSIQQKAKIILHIRDNSISNVSFCRLKKVYERWQFVKKCQTQRASNGLRVRSNCNSQIPVNSLTKSFTYNLRELWKNSDISFGLIGLIWKVQTANCYFTSRFLSFCFDNSYY